MSAKIKNEESIFYEAMELPRDKREAFLKQACKDNKKLLMRLIALLDVKDSEYSLVEAASSSLELGLRNADVEPSGTIIGR